jgi:hypothetical protein
MHMNACGLIKAEMILAWEAQRTVYLGRCFGFRQATRKCVPCLGAVVLSSNATPVDGTRGACNVSGDDRVKPSVTRFGA